MSESQSKRSQRCQAIDTILSQRYPNDTALRFESTLQLLVATILSAQCTDAQVNKVTPELFKKYPDAKAFAKADMEELEQMIFSTGFYRQKAKSIKGCGMAIVENFGGEVPRTLEDMVKLPGVGRKTGNLVLGIAEGLPGVVVDTHVTRLAGRMGLTVNKNPEKIEKDINELLPPERWMAISSELIYLGREFCPARKPKCGECPVAELCSKVGVEA
ncbi:MAG: endonuclease III [bacterium]|nr:endonuclease III [bacterium]MDT8365023.1 endonuclease III [bacterium]